MNNLRDLIKRCIEGNASEEEQKRFEALMKEDIAQTLESEAASGENEVIFNRKETFSKILAEIKERETNESGKVVPITKKHANTLAWMTAAAVVLIGVTVAFYYIRGNESPADNAVAKQETIEKYNGKQYLHLPDGSTVVLNEGSELSYDNATFGKENREVILTGEAYFDVTHDPSKIFVVRTGKVRTRVLGTAFNVKAYPGQQEVTVTVTRGKVEVGDEGRVYGQITPDQQIAVNISSDEYVKKEINAETVVNWKSSYVILDNVTMEEAAKAIGEKYHVSIILSSEALKKCRITSTFMNDERLALVLEAVSGVVNATYEINGDTITINGEGCQ